MAAVKEYDRRRGIRVQSLYRLSMNLLFAQKKYHILWSATAIAQYMDRCHPRRQNRAQTVYGLHLHRI